MRATELLRRQHRTVETLFAKIEGGDTDLIEDLANALAAHMTIEHEIFYPVASQVDAQLVIESFEEHSVAELALKRALATDLDDESFIARVAVLRELIRHHVREEEENLFPEAESELSNEQLEALGDWMEIRFNEVLIAGYAVTLPNTFDLTAADLARAQGANSAGGHRQLRFAD